MNRYKAGRRRSLAPNIAAVVLLCGGAAQTAEAAWVVDGKGGLESRYDDNVRLSTNNGDSAVVSNLLAELNVRRVTENSYFSAIGGGRYLTYTDYNGQRNLHDEDIEYLQLQGRTGGERTQFGIDGSVRRDVLLRTIGFIVDPLAPPPETGNQPPPEANGSSGEVVAGGLDAGSVQEQVRRVRTSVAPYANYQISQRTGIRLGYTYLDVRYSDQSAGTGLQDSQSNAVTLDLNQRLSERDIGRIGVRVGRFDPQDTSSTDAYEASVGWVREFSQTVRAGIDLGVQESERNSKSYSGYLARVYGTRRTDNGAMFARFQHSLQPSGYGDLVETDTVTLGYTVNLTNRVSAGFTGSGYRTRNSQNTGSNPNNDRDYVDVGPQITYALTEVFNVRAFYDYRWVDRQSEGSGQSNAVGLSLTYQPRRGI